MRKVCFIVLFNTLIVINFSCETTKQTSAGIQRIPAKFDYAPSSRTQSGSAGLTIALVKTRFIGDNPEYYAAPFNEMAISMGHDFEELLSAKGFTMRGPFGSRDEMVYNDKINSNFAIEINIDLNASQCNRKYKTHATVSSVLASGNGYYKLTGEVILAGNFVITATSPQYGEKIWKKNIPLERRTFTYIGSVKWNSVPTLADEIKKDNEVYNSFTRELEKFYVEALNLAWRQIDVEEMKTISLEAKKADTKSK